MGHFSMPQRSGGCSRARTSWTGRRLKRRCWRRWRDLLTESVEDGRTLLREVLCDPLVFTAGAAGYHFRGRVKTGELIAGAVNGDATKVASPPGFEPGFQP